MDGQRRNDVQTFVYWQERTPDYPPPIDVWELDRQAMLRQMQRRDNWIPWVIAIGAVLAGLGIVFLLNSFGVI